MNVSGEFSSCSVRLGWKLNDFKFDSFDSECRTFACLNQPSVHLCEMLKCKDKER
jgi:hypothetical protein